MQLVLRYSIAKKIKTKDVTPSKHIRHAQVMGLHLEIVTSIAKDFQIRKYNIWPLEFHTPSLNTNLWSQMFTIHIHII